MSEDNIHFTNWNELLLYVQEELPVYYKAPMNFRAVQVKVKLVRGGNIRVYPPSNDCDPFTADEKHLMRFQKKAK